MVNVGNAHTQANHDADEKRRMQEQKIAEKDKKERERIVQIYEQMDEIVKNEIAEKVTARCNPIVKRMDLLWQIELVKIIKKEYAGMI